VDGEQGLGLDSFESLLWKFLFHVLLLIGFYAITFLVLKEKTSFILGSLSLNVKCKTSLKTIKKGCTYEMEVWIQSKSNVKLMMFIGVNR
jgi:hypothetical protein